MKSCRQFLIDQPSHIRRKRANYKLALKQHIQVQDDILQFTHRLLPGFVLLYALFLKNKPVSWVP